MGWALLDWHPRASAGRATSVKDQGVASRLAGAGLPAGQGARGAAAPCEALLWGPAPEEEASTVKVREGPPHPAKGPLGMGASDRVSTNIEGADRGKDS